MSDLKFWLAFNRVHGLGTQRYRLLLARFQSLEEAWRASASDLEAAGLDARTVANVLEVRPTVSPDDELGRTERAGLQALTMLDEAYPPRLKEIYDPPPVLYVRGKLLAEDERSVAVVGTRKATAYGREAAAVLTSDLARQRITIVSGLARGIDAVAHRAALDAGGRTLAVMANGLDMVYPPEHKGLAEEIAERGAVLSEHPIGVRPDSSHFPRRNRILSGMTLGTLVIEAGLGSGALWTVRHALEQDREVFCVPGSIFSPASQGANRLIQEGAKLVLTCEDVLEELNLTFVGKQADTQLEMFPQPAATRTAPASPAGPAPRVAAPVPSRPAPQQQPVDDTESLLLSHLSHEPLHVDDLRRRTGLPITAVSGALALLEMKGLARDVGGMHYTRIA